MAAKPHPVLSERVAWTEMRNIASDHPEVPTRIMIATAERANQLKAAAGIAATERKAQKPVLAYSLAWHPNEAEKLDRAEMSRAANDSLRVLGLEKHQAVIVAHRDTGQSRLHRTGMAPFGFLLPDLHDLAHPGRGGHVRDARAHQVGAAETGIERGVEQRQAAQVSLLPQDQPDQGHLVGHEGWFLAHHAALVPDSSRRGGHGHILAGFYATVPINLA